VGFSAEVADKNVVVLAADFGGGSICYSIRSRYENSTEQISIDGVLTVRPFIANYASVCVVSGTITSIDNYIEAPDTSDYVTYHIEESTYDVNTFVKTVNVDGDIYRETFTCSGNNLLICYPIVRLSSNGDFAYRYDFSRNQAKGGPFEISGFTFNDVRLESYTGTRNEFRARAKGIGLIYRRRLDSNGSTTEYSAIYYQANGTEDGAANLVGTPFESGGVLDGLFF